MKNHGQILKHRRGSGEGLSDLNLHRDNVQALSRMQNIWLDGDGLRRLEWNRLEKRVKKLGPAIPLPFLPVQPSTSRKLDDFLLPSTSKIL